MNIIKLFKSIADETRLRILRILLHGNFHVNEIQFIINAKQSNISHHLKILQESGILTSKKEGSLIYYRISDNLNSNLITSIIKIIKQEEITIKHHLEDLKRLESILEKRVKHAKEFFNAIGKDFDNLQAKLLNGIYSVDEAITLFNTGLKTIVDIGCGTGRNLPVLAKQCIKVIGFDSSYTMLQLSEHICKENKLNYEIKLGDILALPFAGNSIDGVFMNMALHHVSDPLIALKEISRILVPNGQFVLVELLTHEDEMMREKYADLWLGFSEEELSEWFAKSNFIIKQKIIKAGKHNVNLEHKVIIILAENIL